MANMDFVPLSSLTFSLTEPIMKTCSSNVIVWTKFLVCCGHSNKTSLAVRLHDTICSVFQ